MVLIAPLSRERKMAVSNVTTKRAYELALDPATEKRKESLSRAEKEVAHLFEGQCFAQLVKEYKSGVPGVTNGVVRLMLVFGEPAGEHAGEFLGLGALAGAPSYRVAAAAGLLVDTLRQRDLEADGEDEEGRDPAGERGGGANDADDTAAAEYWRTQQRIDDQANEMLRRALGAVKGEGPVPQFLRDCAERVATPDAPKLHNITAQLRTVQPLMPPSTARIPFVHRLIPPLTERYPPPPPQSTTYEPRGYDDVLNEDALIEWREWLSVQARNMASVAEMAHTGNNAPRSVGGGASGARSGGLRGAGTAAKQGRPVWCVLREPATLATLRCRLRPERRRGTGSDRDQDAGRAGGAGEHTALCDGRALHAVLGVQGGHAAQASAGSDHVDRRKHAVLVAQLSDRACVFAARDGGSAGSHPGNVSVEVSGKPRDLCAYERGILRRMGHQSLVGTALIGTD